MSRSHARRTQQPRRRSNYGHNRQGAGTGVWLLAGIILALFLLGLFFLHKHPKEQAIATQAVPAKTEVKKDSKGNAKHKTKQPELAAKPANPKFDFYTLLPNPQEATDADSATTQAKQTTNAAPVTSSKPALELHQYILQAGAYKNYADADKVRAKLILQGFDVQIKAAEVKGVTWQRIIVGPYKSLPDAQKSQQKLAKVGVKSLLFQLS